MTVMVPPLLLGRRAALIAGSVAGLLILCLIVLPVVAMFTAQADEIDDATRQLAIYNGEIAQTARVTAELKMLRQNGPGSSSFIAAASDEEATAVLEGDLRTIVANAQGEIRSANAIPAALLDDPNAVAVQYDLSVPAVHLKDLVYAIETHSPYYFLDHIVVTDQQDWSSPDSQKARPMLDVRWTVRALKWSGSK